LRRFYQKSRKSGFVGHCRTNLSGTFKEALILKKDHKSASLIDKFLRLTEGTAVERRVKLREFIFRQNTGRWPCHLKNRIWREGVSGFDTWSAHE